MGPLRSSTLWIGPPEKDGRRGEERRVEERDGNGGGCPRRRRRPARGLCPVSGGRNIEGRDSLAGTGDMHPSGAHPTHRSGIPLRQIQKKIRGARPGRR